MRLCVLLLCVWGGVAATDESPGQVKGSPTWRLLVKRLDASVAAKREQAFWALVEKHSGTRDQLADLARQEKTSAQARWALERALRYITRGYTRRFWRVAGDYLDQFERRHWRQRNLRLTEMVELAGPLALEPMRVVALTDPALQVRRHAGSWVARLTWRREAIVVNKAIKAGKLAEAVALVSRLVRAFPEEPEIRFQHGCVLSLAGRLRPALEALAKAIELGFDHLRRLKEHADLDNIRTLPEFAELLKKIK